MSALRMKAAQAIWERGTSDLRWDELTDDEREQMGDIADAAIAAVREHLSEVTMAMWWAGEEAAFEARRNDRKALEEVKASTGGAPATMSSVPPAVWRAMLTAAFEGKP